jgi:hypothetical protein
MATAISSTYSYSSVPVDRAAVVNAGAALAQWGQRLLAPAAEAAATLGLLKYQEGRYDDKLRDRLKFLEAAIKEWTTGVDALVLDAKVATDDIPAAAIYQPVQPSGEQLQTILDQVENLEYTRDYALMITQFHREHELARAEAMNPNFTDLMNVTWISIDDLVNGKLPIDEVMEITTDLSENALLQVRIGNIKNQTIQSLGISRLRAQQLGRSEHRLELQSQSQNISPLSRMGDLRDMVVRPETRIAIALQQGQLIQQSLQNDNNALARKAPYLKEQMNLRMQKLIAQMQLSASKGSMGLNAVPNYAAALEGAVGKLGDSFRKEEDTTGELKRLQRELYSTPLSQPGGGDTFQQFSQPVFPEK